MIISVVAGMALNYKQLSKHVYYVYSDITILINYNFHIMANKW